jgi:hypothetical protein
MRSIVDKFIAQLIILILIFFNLCISNDFDLQRIKYNHPGLEVDLGVGLWALPLPMDYDQDGDYDLLVSCNDVPYNGIYFFENKEGNVKLPVFEAGVKIAKGFRNIQVSQVTGHPRILMPGYELVNFRKSKFEETKQIYPQTSLIEGRIRANQWKYCDIDSDLDLDLIIGVGDWTEYGWDNAFDAEGNWTRGPLHGYVYLIKNNGSDEFPEYLTPQKILAEDEPIDVYGMPSPNLADFDNDGDLDIICGEFLDKFTYFENIGNPKSPCFKRGRFLTFKNQVIKMDLEMIVPSAIDWDKDGDVDLIVGQEDGRVAFMENTGNVENNVPQFMPPVFFRQKADEVKFGALATPVSFDWDNDGDEDLICGNTAGYIGFVENLDGGNPPKWAEPVYLNADGKEIRMQAGENGSIQGPCEAKWGYTTLSVVDWDYDGLADILVNSIWGKVEWFKNIGNPKNPELSFAGAIQINWEGKPPKPEWNWWYPENNNLATQWRTTPAVIDLNQDNLNDLVMLDHEGYLSFFERFKENGKFNLLPGKRIFYGENISTFDSKHRSQNTDGGLLQLNTGIAGKSGRRKFCFTDWDGDKRIDILVNSENINFLKNISNAKNKIVFQDMGKVDSLILAGHTTSPTTVDWDKNGVPDLLIGAEDGYFYYKKNPFEK